MRVLPEPPDRAARSVLAVAALFAVLLVAIPPAGPSPGRGVPPAPTTGAPRASSASTGALSPGSASPLARLHGPLGPTHNWTEECSAPCASDRATMAYDAAAGYVLYLDGVSTAKGAAATNGNATWKFVDRNWTALGGAAPPYRQDAAMAYDNATSSVILFGGCLVASGCTLAGVLGDTWSYSGGTWRQLSPPTSPPARYGAAMAYDTTDHALVLFGGETGSSTLRNDTWEFANGTWTRAAVGSTAPPPLVAAGAANDPALNGVLLAGGWNGTRPQSATWSFSGTAWTLLTPTTPAPAAEAGAMAYDSALGAVVYVPGGVLGSWSFAGGNWAALGNVSHGLTYTYPVLSDDPHDRTVVLFGGYDPGCNHKVECGATWEYTGGRWVEVVLTPAHREGAAMAYDPVDHYVVLFGGINQGGVLGDTWVYLADNWTRISPRTAPLPRAFASLCFDAADGYLLLFGGFSTSSFNDSWKFLHGKWTQLHPTRAPTVPFGALMDYDASATAVLLFDQGPASGNYNNSTWSFHAGQWTLLRRAGGPTVNLDALAYDPNVPGVIALGANANGSLLETWRFQNGSWSRLTPAKEPPGSGQVVYQGFAGEVLYFSSRAFTWDYAGAGWARAFPVESPPGRLSFGYAFDGRDAYALLFGGFTSAADSFTYWGDTWSY